MNILDLDDPSTWYETYKKIVKDDPFGIFIENALSQKADDELNNIFQALKNRVETIESEELLSFRQRCCESFKEIYTDVIAYHACRPKNVQSYLSEGIIPADTKKLIEEAKIFFNDEETVIKTFKDIMGQQYLDHGSNKIGFFMSRTGSLEPGYSHYLEYGSELFQCIANRLGEKALQKLSNQGTPTLFRCVIPVSWLDEFTTFPMLHSYALSPLVQFLTRSRWPEKSDDFIRGAFLLKRSLPKEHIIDYIDMTSMLTKK